MIQMQTNLVVADNSGAKIARCIKVIGGSKHMIAGIGSVVIASVVKAIPNSKIEKGKVVRALIVRTRSKIKRNDNSEIFFGDNAVVIVDKNGEPVGTRVFGPIAREIRQRNYLKIASLASEVV